MHYRVPAHVLILLVSWDIRAGPDPAHKHQAHDREILSVAYHPVQEWLVITGSADKVCLSPVF